MKKRIGCMALVLLLVMGLAACGQREIKQSMTIQPSEFSEETRKVLTIVEDELVFFDYEVDETIRSKTIDIWQYQDGQWVSTGCAFGNLDSPKGRMAVRINEAGYDIYTINDDGFVRHSYDSQVDFSQVSAQSAKRLGEPTAITAGVEIPLWVQLGYADSKVEVGNAAGDFRQADCDEGLAVTITFFEEAAEH